MSDLTTIAAQQAATYLESLYANGYIAVGNGDTAFDVSDTTLAGASQARAAIATSSVAAGVVQFRADFGPSAALFEWLEVGVFDAASGGNLMLRKVISAGTKPNTETWGVELDLTVTAAE